MTSLPPQIDAAVLLHPTKLNDFLTTTTLHSSKQHLLLLVFITDKAISSLIKQLSSLQLKCIGQSTDASDRISWSTITVANANKLIEILAQYSKKESDESKVENKRLKTGTINMMAIFRPSEEHETLLKGLLQGWTLVADAALRVFVAGLLDTFEMLQVVGEVPVKLKKYTAVEWLASVKCEESVKLLLGIGCDTKIDAWLMKGEANVIKMFMTSTGNKCFIDVYPFHRLAYAAKVFPERIDKIIDVLETIVQILPPALTRHLLTTASPAHFSMSCLQYCCRIQSCAMFHTILNHERISLSIDEAYNFDVTDLMPETMRRQQVKVSSSDDIALKPFIKETDECNGDVVGLSCLEIIVASSSVDQSDAAKLLNTMPVSLMVQHYTFVAKMVNVFMFTCHVVHIASFTGYSMTGDKTRLFDASLGCLDGNSTLTTSYALSTFKYVPIIWIIWPTLAFSYSFVQLKSYRSVVSSSKFNSVTCASALTSFPYVDGVQLLLMLAWAMINASTVCVEGYSRLLSVIFLIGWLRPLKYLSFGKHWNAFVVALKSSVFKYIVSFLFVFVFVFLGFSFAIRAVMMQVDGTDDAKSLDDVVYVSFISVFGMGDLSDFPTPNNNNLVFLRIIISMYCAVSAILILAMLRQPDDDLVARVGLLRSQRVKLELVKEIVWYVSSKRALRSSNWGSDNLFCCCLFVNKILGFYDFAKEYYNNRFYVRVCEETIERWRQDKIAGE